MVRQKAHSVIYVPVTSERPLKLPVILLPDGSRFYEALHWTVERHRVGLSGATLKKQNQAVATFLDFYYILKKQQVGTAEVFVNMLGEFKSLRTGGCEVLGWKPISPQYSEREIEYLSLFFDYCAEIFDYIPINALVEVRISELPYALQLAERKKRNIKRNGLLGHIWRKTKVAYGISFIRPLRLRQQRVKDSDTFKTFPPDKVSTMIESCHSIRDVLAFLLMFYGGIRSSELCHILVLDVAPFSDKETGGALVSIVHPEHGWVSYYRKRDHKFVKNIQRKIYLQEEFGLTPRNLLPISNSLHAGWKGMTYESKGYINQVKWSRPDIGILFYEIHKRYMIIRSRTGINHPYYFVNSDPTHSRAFYGDPMKLKSLRDRFYDACRRIGLEPGKINGVNPHGARHFYGYFLANVLKVSKEMAQLSLHHASIESTDVYYNLSPGVARDALISAFNVAMKSPSDCLLQKLKLQFED